MAKFPDLCPYCGAELGAPEPGKYFLLCTHCRRRVTPDDTNGAFPPTARTPQHRRLLYLLARYTGAQAGGIAADWLRQVPFLTIVFEGILFEHEGEPVFDYDYAPAPARVDEHVQLLAISQDAVDDIDDLRESGLARGMKITTKTHEPETVFQIEPAAMRLMDEIPDEDKRAVDALVSCDQCQALLEVSTSTEREGNGDGGFVHVVALRMACSQCGFERPKSLITEPEDVSYVTSPWLPETLAPKRAQFESNAAEIPVIENAGDNVRDRLDESIVLGKVRVSIHEFVPFGANHVVALNAKLGADERVKRGYYTQVTGMVQSASRVTLPVGLTEVDVLDHAPAEFLTMSARVEYPEDEGIVQVEEYGIQIHRSGRVTYGMALEANRACGILRTDGDASLDVLPRILVDVTLDSSRTLGSLLFPHQQQLLELVYRDNEENRPKFSVVRADRFVEGPEDHSIATLLDKEVFENELKQVLGQTQGGWDRENGGIIVLGSYGVLVVGEMTREEESDIAVFGSLHGASLFVDAFFSRCLTMSDQLSEIRRLVSVHEEDPNAVPRLRAQLAQAGAQIILLEETLSTLSESLAELPPGSVEMTALPMLSSSTLLDDLDVRIKDLKKVVLGCAHEHETLLSQTNVIAERQMFALQEAMRANTRNLEDVMRAGKRSSNALSVMEMILAGALAFDILDRITGEWSVADKDAPDWAKDTLVPLVSYPLAWFAVSIALWALIAFLIRFFTHRLEEAARRVQVTRLRMNRAANVHALESFLQTRRIREQASEADRAVPAEVGRAATHRTGHIRRVAWSQEELGGVLAAVDIELTYMYFSEGLERGRKGFILSAAVTIEQTRDQRYRAQRGRRLREGEVSELLEKEFAVVGVFDL